jgi:hypothetical protein
VDAAWLSAMAGTLSATQVITMESWRTLIIAIHSPEPT